jgi:hypothetical protein
MPPATPDLGHQSGGWFAARSWLSDADRELLAASLLVSHPSRLGEMTKTIDPGLSVVAVEQTYSLDTNDTAQRVDCAACHRTQNHWRGFVVRLSNEQLTTIGRTCGTTKHHLEYREQIAEFTARQKRRRSLDQLLAAFRYHNEAVRAAEECLSSPALKQLQAIRGVFAQRFPSLTRELLRHPDGILYGKVSERDFAAERERDSRRDSKISSLARQLGVSPDDPKQQSRLRAEFADDPDFSRDPITKEVRKQTGYYRGTAFLNLLDTLRASAVDLRYHAIHMLDSVDGKATETLTPAQMTSVVSRFCHVLRDLILWHNTVVDAVGFFDNANLKSIGEWIRRSKSRLTRIGELNISSGILSIGSASMRLPNMPHTPHIPIELNRIIHYVTHESESHIKSSQEDNHKRTWEAMGNELTSNPPMTHVEVEAEAEHTGVHHSDLPVA